MELAGLSVSQALYALHPPTHYPRVLVACGPGNNGGDGLVAARHLLLFGYRPRVYYPKQSSGQGGIYLRLVAQLRALDIEFVDDFAGAAENVDCIVDAIFGFSFKGEVREPFGAAVRGLEGARVPVLAVDAPSSWNIETGPPREGPGSGYMPTALISLTAPKPLVKWFKGRHFVGGRFLGKGIAEKYGLDVPEYKGSDQFVEIVAEGEGKL